MQSMRIQRYEQMKSAESSAAMAELEAEDEFLRSWKPDASRGIMVKGRDMKRMYREVDRRGWNGVLKRLEKDGHGDSRNGYRYA